MPTTISLNWGLVAIVDDADAESVRRFNWNAVPGRSTHYAMAVSRAGKLIAMHRMLMGFPYGKIVDHKDHDGLNNQRSNLRLATHQQNTRHSQKIRTPTSSRFKGVHLARKTGKKPWRALINIGRKQIIRLGYFETEELAARAYDIQAAIHFGEFAVLNFPHDGK